MLLLLLIVVTNQKIVMALLLLTNTFDPVQKLFQLTITTLHYVHRLDKLPGCKLGLFILTSYIHTYISFSFLSRTAQQTFRSVLNQLCNCMYSVQYHNIFYSVIMHSFPMHSSCILQLYVIRKSKQIAVSLSVLTLVFLLPRK